MDGLHKAYADEQTAFYYYTWIAQNALAIKPRNVADVADKIATKSLSEKPGCAECDPCACEVQHGEIVLCFFLPADEQSPEPVEPRVSSFHDPVSRPIAWNPLSLLDVFSS